MGATRAVREFGCSGAHVDRASDINAEPSREQMAGVLQGTAANRAGHLYAVDNIVAGWDSLIASGPPKKKKSHLMKGQWH